MESTISHRRTACALALALGLAAPAIAAARPFGPPPEAFTACQDHAEGSACGFDTPRGRIEGLCRVMREKRLVCVPNRRSGRQGPPMQQGMTERQGPMMQPGGSQQPMGQGQGEMARQGGQQQDMGGRGGRGSRFGADIAADNPDAVPVASHVPDTGQGSCFDTKGIIPCPRPGQPYYGQDANYIGARPSYRDNGDGTVTDRVTGLMWEKAHHAHRLGYYAAAQACSDLDLGGHRDWRLPTIKELFSIADFRGSQGRRPYLPDAFDFHAPGPEVLQGDRFAASHSPGMMGQTWSSTIYTGVHFGRPGVEAAFFFNFLDGHIKQAPTNGHSRLFYRCVRGPVWGGNHFVDNGDGTVTDQASGLTWQQRDDGRTYDWPQALRYCQDLSLGGHRGWRLPNVKELEGIVDYRRHAPALDERYLHMSDAKGWFWSSTTHGDNIRFADYVCFGACTDVDGLDTHGAGAQRSDPKVGNPADYPPLGGERDAVRIDNYVRCVR